MKRALLLTGGDYHKFATGSAILAEFLQSHGSAQCTCTEDRDALLSVSNYDVVILYTQGGRLSDAQETTLCDWAAAGGAVVAIHCAADSFSQNNRYVEMIGSAFVDHGPVTEFSVNMSDPRHEITRSLREFRIIDEFYILKRRTEHDPHWLLSGNWRGEPHPLAYVREYGRGRVFYTALGHDERAFGHPTFQKLIHRAIWWATRSTRCGPVRCGVVGYGGSFSMGKVHAETIQRTPGLELSAVCEVEPLRLEAARKDQPDVKLFKQVKEMCTSGAVDLAVVVTPHSTHIPIALELLSAGVGVVCEKPFCLNIAEATQLIEVAREKNVLLTVFHNRRWDADFRTIRRIIARGLLGEVFHIEVYKGEYKHPGYWWRSDKAISGGTMYDWGAHFIDWVLNLMPHRMESITGFSGKRLWHDVTNEDYCRAIIRFEGGRSAEVEISHLAAVGKPKWRILGTHGGLTADWNPPVHVVTHVHGPAEKIEVPFIEGGGVPDFYNALVDHLLGGEPLAVTPESARRVISVLELAGKSAMTGRAEPVFVDGPMQTQPESGQK